MVSQATQKIIVIVVLVLALAYLGFKTFTGYSAGLGVNNVANSVNVGQDVLALVDELRSIQIDQSIFSSPLFTSLVDSGVTIYPEDQGRINPFAAIGSLGQ